MIATPAKIMMAVVALGLAYLAWVGYLDQPNLLERVQEQGKLVVVTRISPATYFERQSGPTGFEYDLARRFADELGVELVVLPTDNRTDIFRALASRRVHFAAAGLTITEQRQRQFHFTPSYLNVQQQLVYRAGSPRPRHLGDTVGGDLVVVADSSFAESLREARARFPELAFVERPGVSSESLLYEVWSEQLDYTVVNSTELALNQRFYPELRAAFEVGEGSQWGWAFPRDKDDSLYKAANEFIERIQNDGTLANLVEQHFGHLDRMNYVGARVFMRHVTERLPKYRDDFIEAAAEHGLDWRLVAAIGYQESHWDPKAVSPTGVRGLMMLTLATARHVGIANRLDPQQSIFGGAEYYASMRERIPDRIPSPTRDWLALAAYNVGLGHLEDARIITENRGGDPDEWNDVKQNLPLLAEKEYYKNTRYGYARGWEPVVYVENIRNYYELLVRITEPELLQIDRDAINANRAAPPPGSGGSGLHLGDEAESVF